MCFRLMIARCIGLTAIENDTRPGVSSGFHPVECLWSHFLPPSALFVGNDPRNLQPYPREILLNRECAVDPTEQGRQTKVAGDIELWVKRLAGKRMAVLLLSRHATATKQATVAWKDVGLAGTGRVRDLFEKKDLGTLDNSLSKDLPPQGCKFLLLSPQPVK
jgi:alpha-galactosidase